MKVILSNEIYLQLMTYAHASREQEFSGVGWVKVNGPLIEVYDIQILSAGNRGFTEIEPDKLFAATSRNDRNDLRLWWHRHPIGNGIPGKHNWSSLDEKTIKKSPLGGIPEWMGWSVSIVLTPKGWVGRVDNYKTNKTAHIKVEPFVSDAYTEMDLLLDEWAKRTAIPKAPSWGDAPEGYWGDLRDLWDDLEKLESVYARETGWDNEQDMLLEGEDWLLEAVANPEIMATFPPNEQDEIWAIFEAEKKAGYVPSEYMHITRSRNGSHKTQLNLGWDYIPSDPNWNRGNWSVDGDNPGEDGG